MRSFIGFLLGGLAGFFVVPVLIATDPTAQVGVLDGLLAVLLAAFGGIAGAVIGGFSGLRKGGGT